MKKLNSGSLKIQVPILLAILFLVNLIAENASMSFDLTEDHRFTLSKHTEEIVASADDNVTIVVLLEGKFPAGFKRLQTSVRELLEKLREINPNIIYDFEDPSSGTQSEKEKRQKQLIDENIIPISLNYSDGTELVQKAVFPFAIITYNQKKYIINLLEEQKPGDDEEIVLNKSVALLEYKFANAFKQIQQQRPKNVIFTQGNGEWDEAQTFRLESEIRRFHKVGRVNLDSVMRLDSTIDLVICAGIKNQVTLKNQFKLDQYIMQGGKVIWLLDKFHVSLDSINKYKYYIPTETDNGLDDVLFKYGVRIMPDLIMDLECSQIPQVVGMSGDRPQTRLFPWVYHMATSSQIQHPIVKNIDRVNLFFPSSIDTVKTDGDVRKTVLLKSSEYSRIQLSPVRLTFEMLKTAPDPSKYNQGNLSVAVLVEGKFESFFKNRLTPDFQQTLQSLKIPFFEQSKPTKQLIVSDSDFAKNLVNLNTSETEDIGYNKWERKYYKGNKDFILNAVEYMLDEHNILDARSKEIKLRLLDTVKIKQEKVKWQLINLGIPLVLLFLFGLAFHFNRRKKYAFPS
jgi:ABC-2 type transport system permease protein